MQDEYEAAEDRSELARHHRDFSQISALCEQALNGALDPIAALKKIRNIVG